MKVKLFLIYATEAIARVLISCIAIFKTDKSYEDKTNYKTKRNSHSNGENLFGFQKRRRC